jgi:hypothetical protein
VTASPVCRYCGRPLADHIIAFRGGVPVVGVRLGERTVWCSERHADLAVLRDRAQTLMRFRRSLRWRAGFVERERMSFVRAGGYLRLWSLQFEDEAAALEKTVRELEEVCGG